MKLKTAIRILVRRNSQYFLESVHDAGDMDLKDMEASTEYESPYRRDMLNTLHIAKKTGLYIYAEDLVTFEGSPPEVKKILPVLVKEHGWIKVMRKIANEIKSIESGIAKECKEICRTRNITEKDAVSKIREKFGIVPRLRFSPPDEFGQRSHMGMIMSPTGRIIDF